MAGIYFHIPFCRRKCAYCDFYKTTEISVKNEFILALIKEMRLRNKYLGNESVNTIYFGGGTPSVLSRHEIEKILGETHKLFNVGENVEITFEANPDDLTDEYLKQLYGSVINRLSIGTQSFFDDDLNLMNRRHNSHQAVKSIEAAYRLGFKNISIDLIYGLPELSIEKWIENLKIVFSLPINHLSAYHLTYHEGTRFFDFLNKGIIKEISEEDSVKLFELLIDHAKEKLFDHYEISNFAKEGFFSKHNMGYWFGEKYLGLGPSAHSYNLKSRQWNVSDILKYIELVNSGKAFFEKEILSETNRYNEYIITNLRTKWGISEDYIFRIYGEKILKILKQEVEQYLSEGFIIEEKGNYTLARKGLFISDKIMGNLLLVDRK